MCRPTAVQAVLAIAPEGRVLLANDAFAEMIGHTAPNISRMGCSDIFLAVTDDRSAVHELAGLDNSVVELLHGDLYIVGARMRIAPRAGGESSPLVISFRRGH